MLLKILRSTTIMSSIRTSCRAPKKKKQVEAKIQSNDIINIFKDRADPVIQRIQNYPLFVQQYQVQKPCIYQMTLGVRYGSLQCYPQSGDRKRYLKGMKRLRNRTKFYEHHIYRKMVVDNQQKDYYQWFTPYEEASAAQLEEKRQRQAAEAAAAAQQEDDEDDAPKQKKRPDQ